MRHRTIGTSAVILIMGMAALVGCGHEAPTAEPAPQPPTSVDNSPAPDQPPIDNASPVSLRVYSPGKEGTPLINSAKSSWQALGLQTDGAIEVPPEPTPLKLGWYCPGRVDIAAHKQLPDGNCEAPVPGSVGPAVIIGHINGDGHDGVFRHLDQVKKNDIVDVGRSDGKLVRFVIYETGMPVKTEFPTAKIYGNTDGPEIRLISCGGRLDPRYNEGVQYHRYIDQVIAWGKLAPEQPGQ